MHTWRTDERSNTIRGPWSEHGSPISLSLLSRRQKHPLTCIVEDWTYGWFTASHEVNRQVLCHHSYIYIYNDDKVLSNDWSWTVTSVTTHAVRLIGLWISDRAQTDFRSNINCWHGVPDSIDRNCYIAGSFSGSSVKQVFYRNYFDGGHPDA